jgi:hypothetical protein
MANRMENYRNSITYRIPHEILAAVASHLEDDKSLVLATHVCYLWRSVLLSFHHLWSRVSFKDERCALLFLEKSKSAPVSVELDFDERSVPPRSEIIKESLKRITKRVKTLRAVKVPFLDELLIQPLPILGHLDIITSGEDWPSVKPLATTNLGHLTTFRFELCPGYVSPRFGDSLLDFLRNCPLLEVVFFRYGKRYTDIGFTTDEESTEAVSLPNLRTFTHESLTETIYIGLFNRLSLPPACDVAFTVTDALFPGGKPWKGSFPALRRPYHLFDAKIVKIAFQAQDSGFTMIRTTFLNSNQTRISFNCLTSPITEQLSIWQVSNILASLENSEMARSVEILCFEDCLLLPSAVSVANPRLKLGCLKTIEILRCNMVSYLEHPSSPITSRVEKLVIHPSPNDPHLLAASDISGQV